jgi:hypothetical protein
VPERGLHPVVDQHDDSRCVRDDGRVGRGLEQAAEPLLVTDPLGDVADGRGDEPLTVDLDRGQRDLRRELGAVVAHGRQPEQPHRPRVRLRAVRRPAARVVPAEAHRDQVVDGRSDQLLGRVAEDVAALRVRTHDHADVVDDHHGVRESLEDPTEELSRVLFHGPRVAVG